MLHESQHSIIWHKQLDYQINDKQVHIWLVTTKNYLASNFADYLDEQEKQRAQSFKFNRDRDCFIGSHAALRILLGKYCNCAPKTIAYKYNAHRKPILADEQKIQFNLSHSRDLAIIAISKNHPIGIDIEYMQKKDILCDLAQRFFSPQEYAEYLSLPDAQKTAGFYNCWTRKEAFVKALGIGITCPLKSFTVNMDPTKSAKVLLTDNNQGKTDQWKLFGFNPTTDYCAAVAWHGIEKELHGCKM